MRKELFVLLVLLVFSLTAKAQIDSTYQDVYSYGLDEYVEKCTDIPVVRQINGGTVFNVTYGDGWTTEMKGAFEYACKIWEETLPNCPPINIRAEIGTIRGTQGMNAISKVTYASYSDLGYYNYGEAALRCQIKAVVLKEFINGSNAQFVDGIDDLSFFEETDFTITYNKAMLDMFSFTLYSTPTNKYDFVTLVLRDIAKGLGFSSKIRGSSLTQKIDIIENQYPTKFEERIWSALGTNDSQEAYRNATQGELQIYGEHMKLYAPTEWVDGLSLNAFVPDTVYRLTELLSYQFGKGSVVRNIADSSYPTIFRHLLGWWGDLVTGDNSVDITTSGSTEDIVPYGGSISIESPVTISVLDRSVATTTSVQSTTGIDADEYCLPYHPAYRPTSGKCDVGWSVAILKKDGTWDVVYDTQNYLLPLNVSMSDFMFNYNDSVYSRTCDGHLRCRVTHSYELPRKIYNVTYFAIDYLPQKVEMEFSGIVSAVSTMSVQDDDYYRDIKIDIKNLEGVDRIVVEQLDEGDVLPYRYDVADFKKGYFVATVDKEFYTELSVISYNENGSTRSETLEIEPLEPASENYVVQILDNTIMLQSSNEHVSAVRQLVSYDVQPVNQFSRTVSLAGFISNNSAIIDISSLVQGIYVLSYYDNRGNKYVKKFQK